MKTLPFQPKRAEARTSDHLMPIVPAGGAYIARQPILDARRAVCGYELLYRANHADATDGDIEVSARVLADALVAMGLDTLTHGLPAFVKIPRDVLLEGVPTLLPPTHVVVELTPDVARDEAALETCGILKEAGYRIALDEVAAGAELETLLPVVDYVKVNFPATDTAARIAVLQRCRETQTVAIARGIETGEQFEQAEREGFTRFQGFFFGQTVIRQAREIPARQTACLQLLHALNQPGLSIDGLEDIIKRDTMLTYRLLRAVSSAASALPAGAPAVKSVRLALLLLGRDTARRWVSLWTVAALADPGRGGHSELVAMSIIRARCCELLEPPGNDDGFLLGMCSVLDAILGQPLAVLVGLLPLEADTRAALCGEQNSRRMLLDCVIAYERGHWDECRRLAAKAGLDPVVLPLAYREALVWTRGLGDTAA